MALENNSLTFSDMESFISTSVKKKIKTLCTFTGKILHHTTGPKGSHGIIETFLFLSEY